MTAQTLTLARFLLARIAEDEAAVRALLADGWTHDGAPSPTGQEPMARVHRWTLTLDRVLAECEAKRRIVELHSRDHECPAAIGIWDALDIDPCPTLLVLAQPYADHPDFRDEWRLSDTQDDGG
jgi:hypothetical protein